MSSSSRKIEPKRPCVCRLMSTRDSGLRGAVGWSAGVQAPLSCDPRGARLGHGECSFKRVQRGLGRARRARRGSTGICPVRSALRSDKGVGRGRDGRRSSLELGRRCVVGEPGQAAARTPLARLFWRESSFLAAGVSGEATSFCRAGRVCCAGARTGLEQASDQGRRRCRSTRSPPLPGNVNPRRRIRTRRVSGMRRRRHVSAAIGE